MMIDSGRVILQDKLIKNDIEADDWSNQLLLRVSAKEQQFKKINFKYTIFQTCYFRKCTFRECDFTGCIFTGSNFNGARFIGCTFDYSFFERTIIDPSIIENCCPSYDNIKMRFARSLRINFQQIGDASAANRAILVELEATESSLLKSWKSNESYYRNKYVGLDRFVHFIKYIKFKLSDLTWGNGESLTKLFRSICFVLATIAIYDVFIRKNPQYIMSYIRSLVDSPQILLGVITPTEYAKPFLTYVYIAKYIAMSFFMAILIKKLNRR